MLASLAAALLWAGMAAAQQRPIPGVAFPSSYDNGQLDAEQAPGTKAPAKAKKTTEPSVEIQNPLDAIVTVRANNATVGDVLESLSKQAKLDFVFTGGAETRRVTFYFEKTPARMILQAVLEAGCLQYQQLGRSNFYTVVPRATVQMFPLKHIRLSVNKNTGGAADTWLLDALLPLVPPYGKIALIPPSNSVMVTGVCSSFEIERAIAEIDKPKP